MRSLLTDFRTGRRALAWAAFVCFGLSLVYGVTVHFTNVALPEDDGFITYRYVENLVTGKGLVYNPGERVFGASNPLYLFWLALLKSEARDVPVPDLAVRLNFVFWVAAAVGLFFLLRRLIRSTALAALCAGPCSCAMISCSSRCGMESLLFAALGTWSIWALATRRRVLSAALAGLSVMVRPEGVLLCGVVLVGWLVGPRPGAASHKPKVAGRRRQVIPFLAGLRAGNHLGGLRGRISARRSTSRLVAKSRPLYDPPSGHALWHVADHLGAWATSALIAYESQIGGVLLPVRLIAALASVRRGVPGLCSAPTAVEAQTVGRTAGRRVPLPAGVVLLDQQPVNVRLGTIRFLRFSGLRFSFRALSGSPRG